MCRVLGKQFVVYRFKVKSVGDTTYIYFICSNCPSRIVCFLFCLFFFILVVFELAAGTADLFACFEGYVSDWRVFFILYINKLLNIRPCIHALVVPT